MSVFFRFLGAFLVPKLWATAITVVIMFLFAGIINFFPKLFYYIADFILDIAVYLIDFCFGVSVGASILEFTIPASISYAVFNLQLIPMIYFMLCIYGFNFILKVTRVKH